MMLSQIAKMVLLSAPSGWTQASAAAATYGAKSYSTVFEKLGGKDNVKAAVDNFYKKILADPVTAPYFKDIDMKKQAAKQAQFLTFALGGPNEYKGRSMYEAHKGMNLTDKEFNAVATHLAATLRELGVSEAIIGDALKVVETTRPQVLGQAQ